MIRIFLLVGLLAVYGFAPASGAEPSPLTLDFGSAFRQPEPGSKESQTAAADSESTAAPVSTRETRFGRAGSRWWSVGGAIANNFNDATDANIHGMYSTFLADSIEFGVELGGWYFDQPGQDTGGVSGSMLFRWHFWHWDTDCAPCDFGDGGYRNTFFFDVGIGLLGAFDEVPAGGTAFSFLPRAGAGYTRAFTDDESGPRLTIGVRWHHISNARISGEERNPGRDALLGYVEIQWGF